MDMITDTVMDTITDTVMDINTMIQTQTCCIFFRSTYGEEAREKILENSRLLDQKAEEEGIESIAPYVIVIFEIFDTLWVDVNAF